MDERVVSKATVAFALVYLTFFLDNVLLTVLVPIIPSWVSGDGLRLWAQGDAPLAAMLNDTVRRASSHYEEHGSMGGAAATVGLVLSAKAGVQLVLAPRAAVLVGARGPIPVLRAATAALTIASIVFASCSAAGFRGGAAAACAAVGRGLQGAGAAGAGVGGLALVATALPQASRQTGLAALLGAVALGVLVGYPFGGLVGASWSPAAPFLLIAALLFANLAMQYMLLDREQFNQPTTPTTPELTSGWAGTWATARNSRGARVAWCAGTVLLTTSVMSALEPALPLWIGNKFHPQQWAAGVVFIPDSVGYLVGTVCAGGAARRIGAERLALGGQGAVAAAALTIPHAASVSWLAIPHLILGLGLGAADAALVPALMAGAERAPATAAALQVASSAAYAIGPVLGGAAVWLWSFESVFRGLGVLNLLYAAALYRILKAYPLSKQWGASENSDDEDASPSPVQNELLPLKTPFPSANTRKGEKQQSTI